MKIDRKLNLVVPVIRDDEVIYVYSSPIRRETFEQYFRVISRTFTRIFAEGLSFVGGPRVCLLMMREVAMNLTDSDGKNLWDGPNGIENGLLPEIRRLTNVVTRDGDGHWAERPYEDALKQKLLDDDEISEVEGGIAFFTVISAMYSKRIAQPLLTSAVGMWGWQISSLGLSAYKASLTTSTPKEDTTVKEVQSSIPS